MKDKIMPRIIGEHTDIVWTRVDGIVTLILGNERFIQSKRMRELVEIVKEKFNVSQRQAERYIALAKREIRKLGKEKKKEAFTKALRDREFLLRQVKNDKNYKLALEIMKDRDKLYDIYPEEKLKHTGSVENKIIFVDDIDE